MAVAMWSLRGSLTHKTTTMWHVKVVLKEGTKDYFKREIDCSEIYIISKWLITIRFFKNVLYNFVISYDRTMSFHEILFIFLKWLVIIYLPLSPPTIIIILVGYLTDKCPSAIFIWLKDVVLGVSENLSSLV